MKFVIPTEKRKVEKSLTLVIPLQKAKNKTLTGGHSSDSWDRRLKNEVLVPPPEPLKRDLSKETKKNRKRLKHILGIPLSVEYGVQVPR